MKKHDESFRAAQAAVDRDVIAAHHAIVKSAGRERHLRDLDPKTPAKTAKIILAERTLVPPNAHFFDLFAEELHVRMLVMQHHITDRTLGK